MERKLWREVLEWALLLLLAWVVSSLVRWYVIDTRIVPTGSMIPTIQLQDRLIVDKLFFKFNEFERGDIVVFQAPEKANESDDLVKRIIGLPGEKIEIVDGLVYINDQELYEPYILESPNYMIEAFTIPEGYFYVLGDNSNISKDSHIWGVVAEENIFGRVLIRYWPLNSFGKLAEAPNQMVIP